MIWKLFGVALIAAPALSRVTCLPASGCGPARPPKSSGCLGYVSRLMCSQGGPVQGRFSNHPQNSNPGVHVVDPTSSKYLMRNS